MPGTILPQRCVKTSAVEEGVELNGSDWGLTCESSRYINGSNIESESALRPLVARRSLPLCRVSCQLPCPVERKCHDMTFKKTKVHTDI